MHPSCPSLNEPPKIHLAMFIAIAAPPPKSSQTMNQRPLCLRINGSKNMSCQLQFCCTRLAFARRRPQLFCTAFAIAYCDLQRRFNAQAHRRVHVTTPPEQYDCLHLRARRNNKEAFRRKDRKLKKRFSEWSDGMAECENWRGRELRHFNHP